MTIAFRCAWPSRGLWQNARPHWAQRAKAARIARQEACGEALLRGAAKIKGHAAYRVVVTFFPPDNRKRDPHNFPATAKAYLDGLADALGVDDCIFDVEWKTGPVEAPGSVHFEVTPQ